MSPASNSSSDDETDGSCFKRLRGSIKLPCLKGNVSYEARYSDGDSSPILRKRARKQLIFDETPKWQSKEESIMKGTLCCFDENDSLDELCEKYKKNSKARKRRTKSSCRMQYLEKPEKNARKKGITYSTQEINDLCLMVLRFPDNFEDMEANAPGFLADPKKYWDGIGQEPIYMKIFKDKSGKIQMVDNFDIAETGFIDRGRRCDNSRKEVNRVEFELYLLL